MEFEIISNVLNLALGKALRVAQDKGPFVIKFKQSDNPVQAPLETYMQIDGEYYKVLNPEKIEIRLNPQFPRLRVLKNVSDE